MQAVTMFKGLPASGKTTKAKEICEESGGKVKRINKDDLRAMLDNSKFSKEREKFILLMRDKIMIQALADGYDVIIDDTNLHPKHESAVCILLAELFPNVKFKVDDSFLQVSMKECIRRDALRPNPVGIKVIRRMAKEAGIGQIQPYYIEGLPECIICDLDGTLALMGKRSPYDASTCEEDELNQRVADYVHRAWHKGIKIFFFSGREFKYFEQTERWLLKHSLNWDHLSMRPTGNYEPDTIIKARMFEEHIRGKYNVHLVLDDRNSVVDMWRDLGLTCWQVNEGNF